MSPQPLRHLNVRRSLVRLLVALSFVIPLDSRAANTSDLPSPAVNPNPSPATPPALICFGDSITANGTWVASPEAAGPWRLINEGRAGRKTSDIAAEFPPALAAHPEATGVLVFLGVNDLPARDPRPADEKIASCLTNLQLALDLALERFPRDAIFLGAPPNIDADNLNSVNRAKGYDITPPLLARLASGIEQLARTNRVNFFSLHETLRPGQFSDGLHPNAEGDAAIAAVVGHALSLPAFYVVGDSISIDYHEALELECLGHYRYSRKGGIELARTDLDHPQGANGGDSAAVLEHLREALKNPASLPDTLVVNCGLHDIKTPPATGIRQISLDAYRANLAAIADLVHAAGKRLVWVTTTPLDEQRHNARSLHFHRFERDLTDSNAAAREVMTARGVPAIDLHAYTASLDGPLYRDHVHFLPEVSVRQANFLRTSLDSLPWPPAPSEPPSAR